ncbi:nuclear transport factor 2 family protein [Streptomyces sp. DH24]|uniref:nuclear transport factor 2 family protein n=1 Tax=Streptomyces sp. DH24 TaxID=3040123 RepID=UPI002441A13E|nr:nuclear transport factor 2 family protein [Streptomyces sp. DH24]MDG9715751.1 nuclear transport factor 2 family protein [Streptomyces sp. DH24]
MTQRVELATVRDRLAVDDVITDYAVAVGDGDWTAYRCLFAPGGRADYRSAGGIAGEAGEVAAWLAERRGEFPVRQHLVVNRQVRFGVWDQDTGDTVHVRADYVSPALPAGDDAPVHVSGGRYAFALLRTPDGWRLSDVVAEELWRRAPGPSGAPVIN